VRRISLVELFVDSALTAGMTTCALGDRSSAGTNSSGCVTAASNSASSLTTYDHTGTTGGTAV
jgi:hypothetical protein